MISMSTTVFLVLLGLLSMAVNCNVNVSEINLYPHPTDASLHTLLIAFQINKISNQEMFPKTELEFSILSKDYFVMEQVPIVLDDQNMENFGYRGEYITITRWTKLDPFKIQIVAIIYAKTDGTILRIVELKKFKSIKNLIDYRIQFPRYIEMDLRMQSVDGQLNSITADTMGTIICRFYNRLHSVKPKISGHSDLRELSEMYNAAKNELRFIFRSRKEDDLKVIFCSADNIKKSIVLNVFHAPTNAIIKPKVLRFLVAGRQLNCTSTNGNPKPSSKWSLMTGPRHASLFYGIFNNGTTFLLKDTAPIGSSWALKCEVFNNMGTVASSVAFTVKSTQLKSSTTQRGKIDPDLTQWKKHFGEMISDRIKDFYKNVTLLNSKSIQQSNEWRKTIAQNVKSINKTVNDLIMQNKQWQRNVSAGLNDQIELWKTEIETMKQNYTPISNENSNFDPKHFEAKLSGNMSNRIENLRLEIESRIHDLNLREMRWRKMIMNNINAKINKITDSLVTKRLATERLNNSLNGIMEGLQTSNSTKAKNISSEALLVPNYIIWKIGNVRIKYEQRISEFSQPFYTDGNENGYRMCLWYSMSKYTLTLVFHLMNGTNDDWLNWPMERTVQVDILNQYSQTPAFSWKFSRKTPKNNQVSSLAYNRPQGYISHNADGLWFFKPYHEILKIRGIIVNDSIVVRGSLLPTADSMKH